MLSHISCQDDESQRYHRLWKVLATESSSAPRGIPRESVDAGKAVTVLTYLHGVAESMSSIDEIKIKGQDIDLIELRTLKPLDMDTIRKSLERTNKLIILDESTKSGGVGATVSSSVSEDMFDLLDAPVMRLSMDDTPVPYASAMEKVVVKRGADLVEGVEKMCAQRF